MSDPLHTDSTVRRTFPTEYSRLLFPVCGGHALWAPRRTNSGGGALGDVGMIVDGAFYREFNVFEYHQEQNTSPLPLPTDRCNRDQAYNTMMMSSSRDSRIEFYVTGSAEVAGLPLQTLDVQPQITLARERDGLAFLTPPVPTRWDGIDPSLRIELGAWLSAQCHTRPELEGRVIVTEVVRSSGYVGGLVLSRHTEVAANLSLGSTITASAGGSIGHRRSLNALLRGPDNWAPNMPAEYPIILRYTTAVTRPGFLRRVRLKLGLSRSASSSYSQPHRTSAKGTSVTDQRSQGNAGTETSTADLAMDDSEGQRDDSVSPPAFDIHEICDPSPLTPFLDMVLEQHDEVDMAIGDLSVISDFTARYDTEPLPDPSHVRLVISVQHAGYIAHAGISRPRGIALLEALDHAQPAIPQIDVTDYEQYTLLPPPYDGMKAPSSHDDGWRLTSAMSTLSGSGSLMSTSTSLGSQLIPQAGVPEPDYMGEEILFVLPSLQHFEIWKASVERALVVDFVKGDRHSSRSTPKAFLEHVKLVCARHSRSGRKPYTKKHSEHPLKVPSRKVAGGCPATITYRTFEDKTEVHVNYVPQHAHETGAANYQFTREGRRQAASLRSKSGNLAADSLSDFDDYMVPSSASFMHPEDNYDYSTGLVTPSQGPGDGHLHSIIPSYSIGSPESPTEPTEQH